MQTHLFPVLSIRVAAVERQPEEPIAITIDCEASTTNVQKKTTLVNTYIAVRCITYSLIAAPLTNIVNVP